jgi:hypothetical protein
MKQRRLHALAVMLIVLSGDACGTGAPTVAPTPASASIERISQRRRRIERRS